MKLSLSSKIATAMLLAVTVQQATATTFFSDTFTNGSTINNTTTPANPSSTNAAYQMLSTKSQTPTPAANSHDLVIGIPSSNSGVMEVQALFATNPIVLVLPGDNIQLTIVFTNRAGILTPSPGTSQLGIGLFNSGNTVPFKPWPGGTNASTALTISGYTQPWLGYVGQIAAGANRIMTRPSQVAAADGWNQELVLSGSSSSTYRNQATVGSTTTDTVTLTTGATYTEVLSIVMNDVNSLAITNTLYSGVGTGGTVVENVGGIATNTTFLTGGFNGLAFGYQTKVSGPTNVIDVSSINVSGSVTAISGPPSIDQQPVDVTVPSGGSCAFSVTAQGYSMTYQWHRNGTNLLNNGNISGATSSQLIISPATAADVAANYYVTVTGAGPFSTNSELHSLSLGTAKNLVYSGSGNWDLNTSASWVGGLMFNYGDAVTFDDTGAGGTVPLVGSYLSASTVTVNANYNYTLNGTGSFAGPGKLIYTGANQFEIQNANTYSGGTIISNPTAVLRLKNLSGLGTGPVTLAKAGGKLQFLVGGSASSGIGDVVVQDDFTLQYDTGGTFAAVILGNLSGNTGKTLVINPSIAATNSRVRVYGTNTVCSANLVINDGSNGDPASSVTLYSGTTFAPYNASGTQTYNGVISGVGGIVQRGTGLTVLNNAQNTYSGGTYVTAGGIAFGVDSIPTAGTVTSGPIGVGPLYVSPEVGSGNGSGTVQAANGARIIANPIEFPTSTNNQTLIIGGTNNLTFTGVFDLHGQTDTVTNANRTVQANNTGVTVFSGVISDAGLGFGLIKSGTNAIYINNSGNTYTGPTTVSAGLLTGTGNIPGSVTVATNASIGGGSATLIGSLAIGGNLTFAAGGGGYFRLNYPANDSVSVTGLITNLSTGTNIVVTNLGSALVAGNTFTLFNKAVTNGGNWTVTGGVGTGLGWTNKLGINGTIQVVQTMATYATNITVTNINGTLTISWPATHLGWWLQGQTNQLNKGLGTNWTSIPGTSTVTSTNLPVVATNPAVFYRLSNTQ